MSKSQPKVAIVTGGADGFGAAIVDRFSREGYNVIFIDLDQRKGKEKVAQDDRLIFVHGSVSSQQIWQDALSVAEKAYGRVDAVVNNAGITLDPTPVHTKPIEDYEKVFSVNVRPIFLSAQVICPFMQKQGSGVFINLTSTGCSRPRPGFAFYNASKAAVSVATKTMALEYAPTIRFNCICPAVGETSMLERSIGNDAESESKRRKLEESLPMKRLTRPADIANAAWFLATDESSFMTGTTLDVDGGRGV